MAKKFRWTILLLVAFILTVSGCSSSDENGNKTATTGLDKDEISNEAFKDKFPLQYESYMKNFEMEDTKYGGSVKRSKFDPDKEPLLPILLLTATVSPLNTMNRGHTRFGRRPRDRPYYGRVCRLLLYVQINGRSADAGRNGRRLLGRQFQ